MTNRYWVRICLEAEFSNIFADTESNALEMAQNLLLYESVGDWKSEIALLEENVNE